MITKKVRANQDAWLDTISQERFQPLIADLISKVHKQFFCLFAFPKIHKHTGGCTHWILCCDLIHTHMMDASHLLVFTQTADSLLLPQQLHLGQEQMSWEYRPQSTTGPTGTEPQQWAGRQGKRGPASSFCHRNHTEEHSLPWKCLHWPEDSGESTELTVVCY